MGKKSKSDTNDGGVVGAMMPGAKILKKGKIILNVATSKETVVFNVGGKKFETYCSTLRAQPNSRLADEKFLKSHFREEQKDYFFDKDPDIFRVVLNYLRTGQLHLPSYICGPAIKDELEYWGLSHQLIERCCWNNYNSWNSTLEALNRLERDRKGFLHEDLQETGKRQTSGWKHTRSRLWAFLNNPASSKGSKIFSVISMIFVFLSIISFLAGTHETFIYFVTVPVNTNGSSLTVKNETISDEVMYADTTENQMINNTNSTPLTNYSKVKAKHPVLETTDIVCLVFFTIEYITRLLTAPRKIKLVISVMGVIDLIVIILDYIELIVYAAQPGIHNDANAMNVIQILRVIRIFRIFRLIRHIPGLWIMIYTLKASFGELVLLVVLMMVGMLIFASLIYFVEDRTVFTSVPRGFWWALITMTTVGYGDMYPVTALGCLIGSFAALSGLLMIGFSVPILVNNFVMYYTHVQFALSEEKKENKNKKRKEDDNGLIDKNKMHAFEGFKLMMVGENETDNNDNTDFGKTCNTENDSMSENGYNDPKCVIAEFVESQSISDE
ncbi:hypothetical protein CHS0354_037174 [Potamilus streckersoni]|uniref:BTB domain-containing protein n=1 Tax=Potamilus streckersoni TaxID=2493646 RepID=A0AAE0SXG8_9BIVA|nr:hypothetical protein CHS0354_037174 [Potamilus streckersoni]